MSKLHEYGGRIVMVDGVRVVEMRDPNDRAENVYQYRLAADVIQRRVNREAWSDIPASELAAMRSVRGSYHPILDELAEAAS